MSSSPHRFRSFLLNALSVCVLSGCVAYGGVAVPYPERAYEIPPGHMPPPGECRVWFPDRPPGQQPPPGNCADLQRRVPSGAVLVRG